MLSDDPLVAEGRGGKEGGGGSRRKISDAGEEGGEG